MMSAGKVPVIQPTSLGMIQLLFDICTALRLPVTAQSRPGYYRIENDHHYSLSIPHIHRNLTDSLLRLFPFCAPMQNRTTSRVWAVRSGGLTARTVVVPPAYGNPVPCYQTLQYVG